jgi:TolB-like protein
LLRRLREPDGETVWARRFDRDLEDAIAASLPVHDESC